MGAGDELPWQNPAGLVTERGTLPLNLINKPGLLVLLPPNPLSIKFALTVCLQEAGGLLGHLSYSACYGFFPRGCHIM